MEKINRQRDIAGSSITLEGFWNRHYWDQEQHLYVDELQCKRPSTRRDMKSVMMQVMLPRFGPRRMDSIKTGEIQQFLVSTIGAKLDGKIGRQTALKYKTYLSSVYTAAMRLEYGVSYNPVRAVKLPSPGPERARTHLTPEEAVAIEEKLTDPRHRMAWKLFLWAGNRCGEVRGLRWQSVVWEHNAIIVTESVWEGNSTPPKTKKGNRKLVLTSNQMAELKEYKDSCFPDAGPEDWIFPGTRNRPLDLGLLMSKHIKPVAKALGIERIHWHALRHLNNSLMLNEGVDVKTRMDRLGHVSENTNMIYSHVGDETQLAASEVIWLRLEAARKELEEKRKAVFQPMPPPLSVTQTVTQELPAPVSR